MRALLPNSKLRDEIFAFRTEPLGEVHKAKMSARSLEFYSKAQANKVIKLFIIWLQIGKAHEIERTSMLPSFFVTISSG